MKIVHVREILLDMSSETEEDNKRAKVGSSYARVHTALSGTQSNPLILVQFDTIWTSKNN